MTLEDADPPLLCERQVSPVRTAAIFRCLPSNEGIDVSSNKGPSIRFQHKNSHSLSICEIQVFANPRKFFFRMTGQLQLFHWFVFQSNFNAGGPKLRPMARWMFLEKGNYFSLITNAMMVSCWSGTRNGCVTEDTGRACSLSVSRLIVNRLNTEQLVILCPCRRR